MSVGLPISTVEARSTTNAETTDSYTNLPTKVSWQIQFNQDLDKSTVTSKNISITDKDGKSLSVTISYSSKKYIAVKPKTLLKNAEYKLTMNKIKKKDGTLLDKLEIPFTTGTSSSSKTVQVKFPDREVSSDIIQLKKENEQLKNRIRLLDEEIEKLREKIRDLEKGGGGGGNEPGGTLTNEYFTVQYPAGFASDARKMEKHLKKSFEAARTEFSDLSDIKSLLQKPKPLLVKLYDRPTQWADVGLCL